MKLQASAVADDRFGGLLRLKSSMPSSRGGVLPRRGCSLQLELETSWPLTAFLPPVSQLAQPSDNLALVLISAKMFLFDRGKTCVVNTAVIGEHDLLQLAVH